MNDLDLLVVGGVQIFCNNGVAGNYGQVSLHPRMSARVYVLPTGQWCC